MRHAPLFDEPGMRSRKEIGVARRKHVHSAFGDQQQVVAHCRRLASLSKHLGPGAHAPLCPAAAKPNEEQQYPRLMMMRFSES